MIKRLISIILILLLFAIPAQAQLGTVPHTFTTGVNNIGDLNENFSTAYANSLNRTGGIMTGSLTSQAILPAATATYDFGSSLVKYRDGWFSRNLDVGGNFNLVGTLSDSDSAVNIADQLAVTSTTVPQEQIKYDASNYYEVSVSSAGAVTLNAVGASQGFTFSDPVTAATISGSTTFTGDITFSGTTITHSGISPYLKFIETDGSSDAKRWRFYPNADTFTLSLLSDSEATENNIFTVSRTGTTVGVFTLFTTQLRNQAGSTSAPAFSFASDTNTGIYSVGADAIGFVTGGSGRWQIDSSGNLLPVAAQTYEIGSGSAEVKLITLSDGTAGSFGLCITETSTCGVGNYTTMAMDLGVFTLTQNGTITSTLTLNGNSGSMEVSGLGDFDLNTLVPKLSNQSSTPATNLGSSTEVRLYLKAPYVVYQYNDGGTYRYKYLDLSGTGVTWVHSTSAP